MTRTACILLDSEVPHDNVPLLATSADLCTSDVEPAIAGSSVRERIVSLVAQAFREIGLFTWVGEALEGKAQRW